MARTLCWKSGDPMEIFDLKTQVEADPTGAVHTRVSEDGTVICFDVDGVHQDQQEFRIITLSGSFAVEATTEFDLW